MVRFFALVLAVALVSCGPDTVAQSGRLGVEGASCLKTSDCEPPLQCISNVCTALGGADADVVSPGDAVADEPTDADMMVDSGPQPWDLGALPDHEAPTADAVFETLADFLPADPGPAEEAPDVQMAPDLPDGWLNPVSDCESLGVASSWEGTWVGTVTYDVPFMIPGAPADGVLDVAGDMAFDIECIDKKLIVFGTMDGMALGQYPFQLELQGGYNPESGALKAQMINGKVTILIVDVLFKGVLEGTLINPQTMQGDWSGESDGTDPPGVPGTATGEGEWQANPS